MRTHQHTWAFHLHNPRKCVLASTVKKYVEGEKADD